MAALAPLTTLGVGGDARELLTIAEPADLVPTLRETWQNGDDWLVLGGGSNVVISDDGFDGTVIRVATRGYAVKATASSEGSQGRLPTVRVIVHAGEPWDDLVAVAIDEGWTGVEALSGIPGSVGAAPMQNIGAYGQDVASTLSAVHFLDAETFDVRRIPAGELGLGYRTSAMKRGMAGVVLAVEFDFGIGEGGMSRPVEYAQLAESLGVRIGDRVPLGDLRTAVLELRASKGMILDPADADSRSAGSFFTNPIVSEAFARTLPESAPRWVTGPEAPTERVVPIEDQDLLVTMPPLVEEARGIKLSAAWLIERSGIRRGFGLPGSGAAVSSKHTLAIMNRGHATADDVTELARYIQTRVLSEFGVQLQPEPVLVGVDI